MGVVLVLQGGKAEEKGKLEQSPRFHLLTQPAFFRSARVWNLCLDLEESLTVKTTGRNKTSKALHNNRYNVEPRNGKVA